MNTNITIIRTPAKKARITPPPADPWYKDMNDNQRRAYIARLDNLDRAATLPSVIPKRASDV